MSKITDVRTLVEDALDDSNIPIAVGNDENLVVIDKRVFFKSLSKKVYVFNKESFDSWLNKIDITIKEAKEI